MDNLEAPRFSLENSEEWLDHFNQYGFSIIENILPIEKKNSIYQQFKLDLNSVSPNFNFDDPNTWVIENTPIMFSKGMAVFNGFGQADFMWELRLDNSIRSIFETLYNDSDLTVSLDGFSLYVSDKQKSKPWLHVDQNPRNDVFSVQGQYNFHPVGEKDSGFIIIPESHKSFIPNMKGMNDWYVLDDNDLSTQSKPVKLLMPENCFTIWDSRLIHANTFMKHKNPQTINRVTSYLAYLPRSEQTDNIRQKRIEAYLNSETTSHWSNKCELKKYPYGFGNRYESRGFSQIISRKINGEIPEERLQLI